MFLGGLEASVFAKIALFLGDIDVAQVLRDFLGRDVIQFGFAFFQARPRNRKALRAIVGIVTRDHILSLGIKFHDAGHQRTLREIIKDRSEHELAHGVANHIAAGSGKKFTEELAVIDEKIAQTCAPFFGQHVSLEGAEYGAQKLRIEKGREVPTALAAKPDEKFRRDRALADPAFDRREKEGLAVVFLKKFMDIDDQATCGFP